MQVPLLVLVAYLLLRQLFCISANLTVNELLSRHRYSYLMHEADAAYYNRFDRGPAANCLQFWLKSKVDWGKAYESEHQVNCTYCLSEWQQLSGRQVAQSLGLSAVSKSAGRIVSALSADCG